MNDISKVITRQFIYYLAGIAALVALAVYLPALGNDFVNWDDNVYVTSNLHIRVLNWTFIKWAFTDLSIAYWHPFALISHAIDYAIWGLDPMGHHLTSIVLHAINTFLVVLLVVRLMEAANPPTPHTSRSTLIVAGVTGLLFGLHPLHVESVAWVAERKDVLYALFYLLSILNYIMYKSRKAYKYYFFSLLFFILALASKAMAVTLPAVLLVLDWYPFRKISSFKQFASALTEKTPFFALSILISFITYLAQNNDGTMVSYNIIPLGHRVPVAFWSLMMYLRNMLFPADLLPFYPYPDTVSFVAPQYFLAILLICGLAAICVYLLKKHPIWAAIGCYYVISLLPVLGFVQVSQNSMADRFTYLSSLGPFLMIGLAAAWIWEKADFFMIQGRMLKPSAVLLGLLLCVAMGYATVKQIAVWRTASDLWNYVIEKQPNRQPMPRAMAAPHINLGMTYLTQNLVEKALNEFIIALKINPESAVAHNNLGYVYAGQNRIDEAINEYKTALRLMPRYPTAHNNLGNAYMLQNRFDEAMNEYKTTLEQQPDDIAAHYNLGNVYLNLALFDKAIVELESAIALNPDEPDAHNNLGIAYLSLNLLDNAIQEFNTALNLDPHSEAARQNLIKCYEKIKVTGQQ
jgi:tetratricopeptide (TPR) repeat protein